MKNDKPLSDEKGCEKFLGKRVVIYCGDKYISNDGAFEEFLCPECKRAGKNLI